jgi:hypothetical protein
MILRAMLAVAYPTGRASHARQVKGDDLDKKRYPGPPGWVFGVGLTTQHSKKLIVTKIEQRNKLDKFNNDRRKRPRYRSIEITLATWNKKRTTRGMKRKTQERMERRSRQRSSNAGSEKMERIGDR